MDSKPLSFGLKESTIQKINGVFSAYPEVEKAVIYGSRAKGTHRKGSDIDLTLLGSCLTPEHLNRIESQLEDLMLIYSIDLSIFNDIDNPDLMDHINRVGQVFYFR